METAMEETDSEGRKRERRLRISIKTSQRRLPGMRGVE